MRELTELAEQFNNFYKRKQYIEAKAVYDTALHKSINLSKEEKILLFGNRPYRGEDEKEVEGLFSEDVVLKVMKKCIFVSKE